MTCGRSALFLDLATELLSRGRGMRFRAEGDSMYPTIRGGETIVVEPVAPSSLGNGDIALYRSPRGVTAHRVVRVQRAGSAGPVFITRGDNVGSLDEPTEAWQILGRVVAVERKGMNIGLRGKRARIRYLIGRYASVLKKSVRARYLVWNTR